MKELKADKRPGQAETESRQASGIGKRVECSKEKRHFLEEIMDGRAVYYHVYLYRFFQMNEVARILEAVADVYTHYPYLRTYYALSEEPYGIELFDGKMGASVHDLSNLEPKERIHSRTRIVSSERRKIYDPERNSMLRVRILKMEDSDYMVMLSLCEEQETLYDKNEILSRIFQNYQICSLWQLQEYERLDQAPKFTSINYWREILQQFRGFEQFSQTSRQNLRETESYELSAETMHILRRVQEKYRIDPRALYFLGFGILLYQLTKKNDICMGEVRENNGMDILPIRFFVERDRVKMLEQIDRQLKQMEKHKNCSRSGVEKLTEISMEQLIPMQFAFEQDQDMEKLLDATQAGIPYEITAKGGSKCPMFINVSGSWESLLRIQYEYNSVLFENLLVSELHSSFEYIIKAMLEELAGDSSTAASDDPKNYQISMNSAAKEKIVHAIMGTTLQKSGIFDGFSKEELSNLGSRCRMRNYVSGDLLIEEKSPLDQLYFVAEGSISMEKLNVEQVMMPVRMLSFGDIFGTESLRRNRTAAYSCLVYSETARIIEMPVSVFWELVEKNQTVLSGLFQVLGEREDSLAALWMLE